MEPPNVPACCQCPRQLFSAPLPGLAGQLHCLLRLPPLPYHSDQAAMWRVRYHPPPSIAGGGCHRITLTCVTINTETLSRPLPPTMPIRLSPTTISPTSTVGPTGHALDLLSKARDTRKPQLLNLEP
jgi:hypothetical protein